MTPAYQSDFATVFHGDCLDVMRSMADDSLDLVFGSPPYQAQRSYGIDFKLKGQAWVDWMVEVFREARRACRGLVAMVVEGFTRRHRWSATPALLMADLHRAGFKLRKPPAYCRTGIPGSGGRDWLANRYEFIVCTSRGRLPWSDNLAMGRKPKYGYAGGEVSYRTLDGTRVNERKTVTSLHPQKGRPSNGGDRGDFIHVRRTVVLPEKANPGNLIHCTVGGGHLGHDSAHENEAPFPEELAEFFIRSFCPPGGVVLDPFSGSGTTAAAAVKLGRKAVACDVRQSQVDLTVRRLKSAEGVGSLFGEVA